MLACVAALMGLRAKHLGAGSPPVAEVQDVDEAAVTTLVLQEEWKSIAQHQERAAEAWGAHLAPLLTQVDALERATQAIQPFQAVDVTAHLRRVREQVRAMTAHYAEIRDLRLEVLKEIDPPRLDEQARETLLTFLGQRMSAAEIHERLGLSQETVGQILAQAAAAGAVTAVVKVEESEALAVLASKLEPKTAPDTSGE
jgi:hypothetical protein